MKNDYVIRKIYQSFMLVSILGVLTATVGMLIDNIIVGQFLGTNALGAMGVVGPIASLFSMVGSISSSGGTAQAAQAVGRGDQNRLNRVFTSAMLYNIVLGVIFMAVGMVFTPQIAFVLGAKGELAAPAVEYLRGYFLGAIPMIMMLTLNSFVRMDGSPGMPLISVVVMSVSDIILDLVMVLVFRQGMFGMALATTLSYFLATAVIFTHFAKKNHALRLILPGKAVSEMKGIVTTGAPTAIGSLCSMMRTTMLNNLLVAVVGAGAVAAFNVRSQANNIISAIIMGIGQALMPVAGMFFGEEDAGALKSTVRVTLKLGMAMGIAVAVILFIVPSVFSHILGVTDPQVLVMADGAVRIYAVTIPIQLFNVVWMNFYQSTKKSGQATMITVLENFAYSVLAAFILIHPFGSNGVWFAFLIGEILTALTLYIYVAYKKKKPLPGISGFMLLGEDFGESAGGRWEFSIGNDMTQVVALSGRITEYGKESDFDSHMLNTLALCIEEIAGNVVQHAFSPGEKRWFDLMILNKDDSVIVRMRDNGREFDPVRYLHENDDAEDKTMGLRLISALTDQFEYRRTLGLNNVIITIDKK